MSGKYTGQYADPLTGFDYYNARYYDPVCGTFLSADPVQGNMQGMNPYAYVDGNPETYTDPTGKMYAPPPGSGGNGSGGGGTQGHSSPPPSCNWWCWVQQQGQRVQDTWNTYVAPHLAPVEHLVQQAQEVIIHVPIIVPIVIGVVAAATIGGFAYAIWQLAHTNPNWTDVSAGENVTHPRWAGKKRDGSIGLVPSKGHVLGKHVNISDSRMQDRARSPRNEEQTATRFYNEDLAQWTVDYAMDHMTLVQKMQLMWMRTNPLGRFATLTLTGNTGVSVGEGWRYDSATGQFTHLTNLSSYRVVIGIDFKTGQPFIVTAFPTP